MNAITNLADTSLIHTAGTGVDTGILTLTVWSNNTTGVKIKPNEVVIGAGGNASIPSAGIRFNGSTNNMDIVGDVYFNKTINFTDLNTPFAIQTQLYLSSGNFTYDNTATSGTHYFSVKDSGGTPKNPLQITATGLYLPVGNLNIGTGTNLTTSQQLSNQYQIVNNATSGTIEFYTKNATPTQTNPLTLTSALCSFNNTDVEINNTKNLTLKAATKLILADGTPTTQFYQSGNNTEIYNTINSGIININARSSLLGLKVPMSIDVQTVTMRAGVNIANVATPANFTTMIQDGNTPSQFNILNNVTSGIITMSCEDSTGTSKSLLDFRTNQTVIGGNGTDFNHYFMSDGTPASTTAKIIRIASSTANGFNFIDSGIGRESGTYPLLFRAGNGLEWLRITDAGLAMSARCMYGRNDGFAFSTIPSGASTQPIGYSFTTSTAVTVTATTNTTVTANLNAGVWIICINWQLIRGSGTFTTASFIASSLISGTGYSFFPNFSNAGFRYPIASTATLSTINANFSSTMVVTGTGANVNPVINTQVSMTIGTATSTLYIGYTKVA